MRTLLDANILLSYLLNPDAQSPPAIIGRWLLEGVHFRALVATETLAEIRRTVENEPYFTRRISPAELDAFLSVLPNLAELLPRLTDPIPAIGRDIGDDYLLVHADRANADVLVTGDEDLLVLGFYKGIWIMSPAEFVAELETHAAAP